MRLFFKHLLRTVRKRPTQPLVLLLTATLSVAMVIGVFSIRSGIVLERYRIEEARVGAADIRVSASGSSDTRFLFTDDVKRVLGEDSTVVGYFDLVLTSESGDPVFALATDLELADSMFDFSFLSYEDIPRNEKSHAALIDEDYAEANSLVVGDEFFVEMFGEAKSYTVYGISKYSFAGGTRILLDISGVVRALSSGSAFAAALGEDFKPYSTLLVDLPDGVSVTEAVNRLRADEAFIGRNVEDVSRKGYNEASGAFLELMITFVAVLACLISSVVAFSCFSILSLERREENYAFAVAGAKPSMLALMQYCEALGYWVLGTVFGTLLSVPLSVFVRNKIGYKYVTLMPTAESVIISSLLLLASLLITVTVFLFSSGRRGRRGLMRTPVALIAIIAAVLYILTFTLPMPLRLEASIGALVVALVLVFMLCPRILKLFLGWLTERRQRKSERTESFGSAPLHYALKNMLTVRQLQSVAAMLALLISTSLCIGYVVHSLDGNAKTTEKMVNADYVVLNGTKRCYDKIESLESVESVERLYIAVTEHEDGADTNILSVSSLDALGDDMNVSILPKGNEAVISYAEAKCRHLDVGDTFKVEFSDEKIELTVCEIVKSGYYFVIFDCESFGVEYNMLIPSPGEGVSEEEFIADLTKATTEEIAAVAKAEKLFAERKATVNIYVGSGDALLISVIIFSLVGIINMLFECYRSRKEEFSLFRTAGMTRAQVRKMKLWEVLLTLLYSGAIGILGFALILPTVTEGIYSIGFDLFRNFIKWLSIL